MSATRLIFRGRRKAESLMVDECIVTKTVGATDNPDGSVTKDEVIVYAGRCRVQTHDPYEKRDNVADIQAVLRRDILMLPVVGSEDVGTGDLVEITAASLDVSLVGRKWRIAGPSRKSHLTQRRLYMEEETQ